MTGVDYPAGGRRTGRRRGPTVCIDGYNLALPNGTGIATYSRNLLIGLGEIGFRSDILFGPLSHLSPDNLANEANLAASDDSARKVDRRALFLQTVLARYGRRAWPVYPTGKVVWPGGRPPPADRYWLAPSLFRYSKRSFGRWGTATPLTFRSSQDAPPPDVMHWTAPMTLRARGIPNICTFHDLIPLRLPHTTTDKTAVYMRLARMAVDQADHIAVVSDTTRRDLVELLGVPEDRITTTFQAVSLPREVTERDEAEAVREVEGAFNVGWKRYFLHYGAIEPKKNLARIIRAYLASGVSTPLILVGRRAWLSEEETALLDEIRRDAGDAAQRIRQYEYLPFDLLGSLIRGARATVFPSLYEGFGLPVLESMALGTAVITSTAGSLPEISGEAATLVSPYDISALAAAFRMVDADDAAVEEMIRKGRVQAQRFSAERYHDRLRTLYAKVGCAAPA